MNKSLAFLGPGRYWQSSIDISTSGPRYASQTEMDLSRWITKATGTLSASNTSYAGAILYIKYSNTNVCPCGMVFHFKADAAGRSGCNKALKAHLQMHEGVHFWDLSTCFSHASQNKHIRYLNLRYPGAAILPFERWALPSAYNGPENVAQVKTFFYNYKLILPTPPPSTTISRRASSTLTPHTDSEESETEEESCKPKIRNQSKRKRLGSEIFCVCRRPDDWSIQCECCDQWFHPTCVGISMSNFKFIDTFYCPTCEVANDEQRASIAKEAALRQKEGTSMVNMSQPEKGYSCMGWPTRKDPMVVRVVYELSDDDT